MTPLNAVKVVLKLVAIALGCSLLSQIAPAESFDKPIRKVVMELGRSKYFSPNDDRKFELDCLYYPAFMVKQLWAKDWKGTVQVTVTSTSSGHAAPCRLSHGDSARLTIKDGRIFIGAKGQLLFLEASDGLNGGMSFGVVDWKTGKNVFEDTALAWDGEEIPLVNFAENAVEKTLIRYKRVVVAECSIPKDGMSCWNQLRTRFSLGNAVLPKCIGYRQPGQKEWAVGDPGAPSEAISTESAITYPVEVELLPRPVRKVLPGPVTCSAAE